MKDVHDIVCRAADPKNAPEARREAFGELVIRFQDMAFACAFAVLGDAYLAQDTAQESFVVAWQKLSASTGRGQFTEYWVLADNQEAVVAFWS